MPARQWTPTWTPRCAARLTAAASDGGNDTIVFDPSLFTSGSQTITLSIVGDSTVGPSDFGIYTNITISGPTGDNGLTLYDNTGSERLFYISATGSLTVENLTLEGGNATGGAGVSGYWAGGGGARDWVAACTMTAAPSRRSVVPSPTTPPSAATAETVQTAARVTAAAAAAASTAAPQRRPRLPRRLRRWRRRCLLFWRRSRWLRRRRRRRHQRLPRRHRRIRRGQRR